MPNIYNTPPGTISDSHAIDLALTTMPGGKGTSMEMAEFLSTGDRPEKIGWPGCTAREISAWLTPALCRLSKPQSGVLIKHPKKWPARAAAYSKAPNIYCLRRLGQDSREVHQVSPDFQWPWVRARPELQQLSDYDYGIIHLKFFEFSNFQKFGRPLFKFSKIFEKPSSNFEF